ncbi:precorrin-2 dehydrogenase/sirohydrochlorin ferrochelatase family protein [Halalkalibacter nanhaiisediminis]|uniref:precorrin-2 dehydrogenase n=1 Tax=Halalkalibacter nanhaiisediminis TaxID=688079 RepID=A0A562QMC9_9BACI|nr:bifunctional precorrin-2 dehydrogenase/sirohydrochlorin ferrochelatase [Halalkalibacter nanhaiisediminis]TWI57894.1 precorrin-2 dehydrogenase/sirohydrochlorin ferrochelatase [Halalkalibacter nanhaiisediminis]
MMKLPLMLKLSGKTATVVGAGVVASRHIPKLLQAGIKEVTVYAPDLHPSLEPYIESSQIKWVQEKVTEGTSFQTDLLLLTTDNSTLHASLYASRKPHQLVYLADNSQVSDFSFPMTVTKGHLTIALSTNGVSPTYGKRIKKQLDQLLSDDCEGDLLFLEDVRKCVLESGLEAKSRKWILQETASETFLRDPLREERFVALIREAQKLT